MGECSHMLTEHRCHANCGARTDESKYTELEDSSLSTLQLTDYGWGRAGSLRVRPEKSRVTQMDNLCQLAVIFFKTYQYREDHYTVANIYYANAPTRSTK